MTSHDVRKPCDTEEHIPVADALRAAVDVAVSNTTRRIVLAVSGGRDSMALLHAVARWSPVSVAAVATFDHGSGVAATEAAALVAAESRRLGLTVIRERARSIEPTEDAWRTARWSFLKRVARGYNASVATAHTRDDQVETIVLRLLRGTGARGLAALAAPSAIVRPWLPIARSEVAGWARAESVPFVEDPTNHTRRYFRSRVRLDLLPALELVHPGFSSEMLALGNRAAELRRDIDMLVGRFEILPAPDGSPPGSLRVPARHLIGIGDAGLAVLWPALLARCGVALNQRGTVSLVQFTNHSRAGMRLELAGKACVMRVRTDRGDVFEMRAGDDRGSDPPENPWSRPRATSNVRAAEGVQAIPAGQAELPKRFGVWRFVPCNPPDPALRTDWYAAVPQGATCEVRAWRDGDRIITQGAPAGRRVARYLSESRVPPVDRPVWPVVLIGEDIVWVPGVCRRPAAPNRPGRPAVSWYRCEREHG
ncbi:MAG: tRNA lysidine(34) synthetase TilS [Phycisphaerae bacterium]|nr:tRNA lysidine(34) synthetase TilS [Gemmatimonadaceae bacterium]